MSAWRELADLLAACLQDAAEPCPAHPGAPGDDCARCAQQVALRLYRNACELAGRERAA